MNFTRHIPNILTLMNLFCGMLALVSLLQNGNFVLASFLVILAAVFDFFDGMVARILGVSGNLGKQLDSLADVVSFGVVPAIMLYRLLHLLVPSSEWLMAHPYLIYTPLLMGLFAALRLAKFNIDTRQSDVFIGVPTPANTLFWMATPLILFREKGASWYSQSDPIDISGAWAFMADPKFIVFGSLIAAYLLVAELPLIALKFKHMGWSGNQMRYVFLGLAALVILFSLFIWSNLFAAIPIVILLYLLLSIIYNLRKKDEIQS